MQRGIFFADRGRIWRRRDVQYMVKGINRQVIVVKSPDPTLFEEAIFLLRQDAVEERNDPDEIIRQARLAADGYLNACALPLRRHRAHGALLVLLGAGLASLLWWAGGLLP